MHQENAAPPYAASGFSHLSSGNFAERVGADVGFAPVTRLFA
jgi:hypothetical protein